eukprot:scaffold35941_cov38-Phaeocystis_antarctica.AAC.1
MPRHVDLGSAARVERLHQIKLDGPRPAAQPQNIGVGPQDILVDVLGLAAVGARLLDTEQALPAVPRCTQCWYAYGVSSAPPGAGCPVPQGTRTARTQAEVRRMCQHRALPQVCERSLVEAAYGDLLQAEHPEGPRCTAGSCRGEAARGEARRARHPQRHCPAGFGKRALTLTLWLADHSVPYGWHGGTLRCRGKGRPDPRFHFLVERTPPKT